MTNLDDVADRLHRTVKLAIDTGEAETVEEAERIFAGYRLQIVVGPEVADSVVLQAAVLTAVNCAARTLLGGVTVVGGAGPLRLALPPFNNLAAAIEALGGRAALATDPALPTLVIGNAPIGALEPLAVRATVAGWSGGVVPASGPLRLDEFRRLHAGRRAGGCAGGIRSVSASARRKPDGVSAGDRDQPLASRPRLALGREGTGT